MKFNLNIIFSLLAFIIFSHPLDASAIINSHSDATSQLHSHSSVDYFANNGTGNSLAIIQHPAGIHVNGVTYVSYQGTNTHPFVAAYNHITNTWQGPFQAGTSDLAELFIAKNRIDSHGKPTMLIDNLGFIHIFYGGHGAGAKYGKNSHGGGGLGRNKHAVSKKPYDISEWEDLDNISVFGSYNQAIKMDNGDIYLVYRHGAHRSDWVYQKSSDHGRTFEPAVPFLKHKLREDIKATDSWYVWASKGKGNDIIFSYDYHVCWLRGEGPKGLGHVTQRHDLYYMALDTKTNTFRNVYNEALTAPITKEVADQKTLVARTGADWTFNGSALVDSQGLPHLSINIGKNLGRNTGGPKQTKYYYWTGKKWQDGQAVHPQSVIENTDTRGDFTVDSNTSEVRFLLAYQDHGDGVVASFVSSNKGKSFTLEKELIRRNNATWATSARIKNAHPDAQIIVAEKQQDKFWRNIYLVGENGPITRRESETSFKQ